MIVNQKGQFCLVEIENLSPQCKLHNIHIPGMLVLMQAGKGDQ